jgi:hypothetical protein
MKAFATTSEGNPSLDNIMKVSQFNDFVQMLATIGAIAGLVLVAYEIRQSTLTAVAESHRESHVLANDLILSTIDSGIAGPLMKAETQPDALTLKEKMAISLWLEANYRIIASEYDQIEILGVDVQNEYRKYDEYLEKTVPRIFSSAWSRAWFDQEASVQSPRAEEGVRRALEKSPLKSRTDLIKQIDEVAATIE